jgi:hypothetical protein
MEALPARGSLGSGSGAVAQRARRRMGSGGTVLALLLLTVTGHPVFSSANLAPPLLALMFVWVMVQRQGRVDRDFRRRFGWLALGFLVVAGFHALQLGQVSVPGTLFFLVKMLAGGLVVSHLGRRFPEHLFQATFYICLCSLFCYGALLMVGADAFPTFFSEDLAGADHKSVLVFTVLTTVDWWRNAGMFWEPGAFQGVINLSILLLPAEMLRQRRFRLRLAVMLLALLSTFSTTGYLVFFLLAVYKLARFSIPQVVKWPAVVLVAALSLTAFLEADFLGAKILDQLEYSSQIDDFSPDRFGALLFDLYYIEKHPLFGNGLIETTRYADHPHLWGLALGHGNGVSNFAATFGLFGLALYGGALLRSRIAAGTGAKVFVLVIVALISFGEQFLATPLFLGLPFLLGAPAAAAAASPLARRLRRRRHALGVRQPVQAPQPASQAAAGIGSAGGDALGR